MARTALRLFATAPIGMQAWLEIFAVGVVSALVVSVDKRWAQRKHRGG
jgi:hypothetical protein